MMVGSALSGLMALLFAVTRPYRRALNRLVIFFSQIVFAELAIGSLLLVLRISEGVGLGPHTERLYAAIPAFAITLIAGEILVIRAELSWRKSVGLRQANQTAGANQSAIKTRSNT